MAENSLFQLAQVVTELPMHHQQPSSPMPNPRSDKGHPLVARKNACIVCAVCFTCSGYYGINCQCTESQPRRGKNLPEGGLDSRAKKLSPHDRDDYEFTLKWLEEFAHHIYRDRNHQIVGLHDLTEVSLCKAHSSTLYRAKKRYQRNSNSSSSSSNTSNNQQQAPPSPADSSNSSGTTMMMEDVKSNSVDSFPLLPQPYSLVGAGTLAAKVREISFQQQHVPPKSPDFSMMTCSNSMKRRRTTAAKTEQVNNSRPSSSASTPLLYNNHHGQQHFLNTARSHDNFSPQLPPLHLRQASTSLSSLSSTFQHNLHLSSSYTNKQHQLPPPSLPLPPTHSSSSSSHPYHGRHHHSPLKIVETVSLKKSPMDATQGEEYHIQNLAITDTYTFRDLLTEIEFIGSPPKGKKVVISDLKRERIFPLGHAIRSMIRYPTDTHMEFYLGLCDKSSIDWSDYS